MVDQGAALATGIIALGWSLVKCLHPRAKTDAGQHHYGFGGALRIGFLISRKIGGRRGERRRAAPGPAFKRRDHQGLPLHNFPKTRGMNAT